jgi:pSer/pThr/pTyr-binding forkhead associated (FHA) protein
VPTPEVVPEAEPAQPVVEAAPLALPAPAAKPACIICGADLEPGDKYCSDCGALQPGTPAVAVAGPAVLPVEEIAPPAPPAIGPRLVVVATGAEIPLPAKDEILIGREDPVSGIFPEVDLTPHGGDEGGVSRRHAKIVVEAGVCYLIDLNSTNFTYLNKQRVTPEVRQQLRDGDEIRCGRVSFILKLGG